MGNEIARPVETVTPAIEAQNNIDGTMRNPRLVSEAIDASRATHLIKKGETLTKIAKEHHTTVNELAKINNIRDVNRIQAGATIKLSTKPITDTPTATAGVAPQQTLSHSSLSSPPERIKSPVTYESIGKELQKANQDIEADMKKGLKYTPDQQKIAHEMFDSGKVDLQKMLKEAKPEEKIKIEVLQKQLTETQAKYDANVESVKSDVKLSSSNDTTMKNLTYDVKKGILQNGKLFSGEVVNFKTDPLSEDSYSGNVKDGKPEGHGKISSLGQVIEGTFKNGDFTLGTGKLTTRNGPTIDGEYKMEILTIKTDRGNGNEVIEGPNKNVIFISGDKTFVSSNNDGEGTFVEIKKTNEKDVYNYVNPRNAEMRTSR